MLVNYVHLHRIGRLFSLTFDLETRDGAAHEPDVGVLLNGRLHRLENVRLRGAADLVMKTVSPDTVARERRVELDELPCVVRPGTAMAEAGDIATQPKSISTDE